MTWSSLSAWTQGWGTFLWKRKQHWGLPWGNPEPCSPWGHLANTDLGKTKAGCVMQEMSCGRQCCACLGPAPYMGSPLLSTVHSKRTDIKKKTNNSIGVQKKIQPKASAHTLELDSLMNWCWERCAPPEAKGDYKCSAPRQRCSAPHWLLWQVIYPERTLGEQNSICRAQGEWREDLAHSCTPRTATSGTGGQTSSWQFL